jgi:glycosyltransferase involved in cell wall biosynthesis
MSLSSHVHLLGARSDVPALLRAADVFAFPSRTEGLPNALLEAMAASCAIVTTDVPGCRDLIRDEENGLAVPHGNAGALASAIRRLLDERPLAARLGAAAAATVERDWHVKKTYAAYEDVYKEMLGTAQHTIRS